MASPSLLPFLRVSSGGRNVMLKMTHKWSKFCLPGHPIMTSVAVITRNFYSSKRSDLASISSPHLQLNTLKRNYFYSTSRSYSTPCNEDKQKQTLQNSDYTKSTKSSQEDDELERFKNLTLVQRFKVMAKDYWYVLVPVHVASSIVFLGIFYYAVVSGVDIVSFLEQLHISESWIKPLRDSSAGYIAATYALYKVFTPVRYTVTVGGTTWAIKVLKARGLIKPHPVKTIAKDMKNAINAMKMPAGERKKL